MGSTWDSSNQDLIRFIERQESYIKQQERDSELQREELSNMKYKIQELSNENESLHNKLLDAPDSDQENSLVRSTTIITLESKITELDAKLTQAKIDVKRLKDENDTLKRQIERGEGLHIVDTFKRQVEDLKRDKSEQENTIKRLQDQIVSLKENEINIQSRRTREFNEKVSYEKTQMEHEIRRLQVGYIRLIDQCEVSNVTKSGHLS